MRKRILYSVSLSSEGEEKVMQKAMQIQMALDGVLALLPGVGFFRLEAILDEEDILLEGGGE